LPAMRRLGIGRALLEAVIADTRRRQLASMVLEVAADNEPARQLYAAAGFAPVGRRPRYYRRARCVVDAMILRLGISGESTPR
jgi:ribosomal-protein-alanine N-acetyltransferase